jgi:hypothetical protein
MVDLETAAMSMTDSQHKAAVTMTGQGPKGEGSHPVYSPDRAALLESSIGLSLGRGCIASGPLGRLYHATDVGA